MTAAAEASVEIARIAAMEPAEDRPDDAQFGRRAVRGDVAAMEPAEDRPDDEGRSSGITVIAMPQWSRPKIGRMTLAAGTYFAALLAPQWSRPKIGRMTGVQNVDGSEIL